MGYNLIGVIFMSLPDFDTMLTMSNKELDELFDSEVEKILESLSPSKVARYLAIANGCKLRRQAAKNPTAGMVKAQEEMWKSFFALNDTLQEARGKVR